MRSVATAFGVVQPNILGGQQWHDEIGADVASGLSSSPNAKSVWVKRELLYALQQHRFDGRIVPLLYKPCSYDGLSWTLAQMQMIDFASDFDAGCRELLRIWGVGYVRR